AEACQKTGFQVHAYCLMSNHFHAVIETPNANLVEGMRWMLSAYTRRAAEEDEEEWKPLRRGWCLGSERFKDEMLDKMSEELRRLRWSSADLKLRMKTDPAKVQIALRLRAETTLTIRWIAERLSLGTAKSANVPPASG